MPLHASGSSSEPADGEACLLEVRKHWQKTHCGKDPLQQGRAQTAQSARLFSSLGF